MSDGVDVENERAECMWTISEEGKILLAFANKKILEIYTLTSLLCMSLTSESERRWSKFGVGGANEGRTVWRVADNL